MRCFGIILGYMGLYWVIWNHTCSAALCAVTARSSCNSMLKTHSVLFKPQPNLTEQVPAMAGKTLNVSFQERSIGL